MNATLAAPAAPPTAPAEAPVRDDPTLWEVDDALWADLRPLLVIAKPRIKPGRPRNDDRPIFNGLIWLARTGSQWKELPTRYGPKSTAHARMVEWVTHGCLAAAWALLLARYDAEVGLAWEWQGRRRLHRQGPLGQKGDRGEPEATGANPTDRASAAPSATC